MRVGGEAGHDVVKGLQGRVAVGRAGGPRLARLGKDDEGRHAVRPVEDGRADADLCRRDPILSTLAGPVQEQDHGKHAWCRRSPRARRPSICARPASVFTVRRWNPGAVGCPRSGSAAAGSSRP